MNDPTVTPSGRTSDEPFETVAGRPPQEPPIGALVHRLSEQIPELVRSELRLAQAELTEKGKRAGLGIGMFSAAGLLAFLGISTLVATAVLGLAHLVPDWVAALIVAVVLFAGAGVVALVGKKEVAQATPPAPERAMAGVREDVATVKGGHA
jgi:uncharacterized membrane protein YqjE